MITNKITNYGGIEYKPIDPTDIPTPSSGDIVLFNDSTNENKLSLKKDTGDVSEVDGNASELPVSVLGTTGIQTINRTTSDKWTISPTGAVILDDSNFTTLQKASLIITKGASNISFPNDWLWSDGIPQSLKLDGDDLIKLEYTGSEMISTLVTKAISTSYSNVFGSGDRTSIITYSSTSGLETFGNTCINGNTSENVGWFEGVDVTGKEMKWDFGRKILVTEIKWYFENAGTYYGNWKMQGSNNDSDWYDLSTSFVLDGNNASPFVFDDNVTPFRYLRMFGVSGTATGVSGFTREVEFKAGF